jgi:bifunctional DNA-binding transcriptional regulator/antitoxin component of YhaV-PrlF toxin-antitoxin module
MSDTKAGRRRAVTRPRNQVTLPREVAEALHVREGDEVELRQ